MSGSFLSSAKQYLKGRPRLRRLFEPGAKLLRLYRPSRQQSLEGLYEYLFAGIEGGSFVVRVPGLGLFEMNCRSDILRRVLLNREYEPEVSEALRKYTDPNKDALDIGANVGFFTVLLTSLLSEDRRVLAVEPTPGALGYLRRNIEANNCAGRVILYEGVAADRSGESTLNVIENREEYSSLLKLTTPAVESGKLNEIRIPAETIDQLVREHDLAPGLIKIDTEGAELQVLQGAKQTILNHRPVILCEVWPDEMLTEAGGSPGAAANFLRECGYSISNCGRNEIVAMPNERTK